MQGVMDDLCWLYHYTPEEVRQMTLGEIRRLHALATKAVNSGS